MTNCQYLLLPERGVVSISGTEARTFLQGVISNDTTLITTTEAIHAALLTPQGKYLYDFFLIEDARNEGVLLLDAERERIPTLLKKLKLYKLRADVTLADRSDDFTVAALIGKGIPTALAGDVLYPDPRLAAMGARAILAKDSAEKTLLDAGCLESTRQDYERLRLGLGVPDGSRDLRTDKSTLMESGFDELGGVSWDKGCYIGQELTARTKHRGLVKRRLVPVAIEGDAPAHGTLILNGYKDAGEMRSSTDGIGLALIRTEYLDGKTPLIAGQSILTPTPPEWLKV